MSRYVGRGYASDSLKRDGSRTGQGRRAYNPNKAHLAKCRVIQRDLVYVIGIPQDIATEEKLAKFEYFGQYGPIKKIVVNNSTAYNSNYQRSTVSAYVTFYDTHDAEECIYALEDATYCGHPLKASFGTSKYCSSFLCDTKCTNPDCMFLHSEGAKEDSFLADDIQQPSGRFADMTRPKRPPDYDEYPKATNQETKFPPKRLLTKPVAIQNQKTADEPTDNSKNEKDFLNTLRTPLFTYRHPIKVNYTTNQSLAELLNLSRPSPRAMLKKIIH